MFHHSLTGAAYSRAASPRSSPALRSECSSKLVHSSLRLVFRYPSASSAGASDKSPALPRKARFGKGGLGFQALASCSRFPARLRALRGVHAARLRQGFRLAARHRRSVSSPPIFRVQHVSSCFNNPRLKLFRKGGTRTPDLLLPKQTP